MQIDLQGFSNLKPIKDDLRQVTLELKRTQAAADEVWRASSKGGLISPQAFRGISAANRIGQEAFADALASSSSWRIEQLKVNSATDDYISRLKKQRVSMQELRKNQVLSNAAYKEQIKLMKSQAFISQTDKTTGKSVMTLAVPSQADEAMVKNMGNRIKWAAAEWHSAGTIIQNTGKNIQWAGRQLTVGLSVPVAAFGAAAGKLAYDLDHGLVQVTKVYNTTANQFSSDMTEQARATKELDAVRQNSTNLAMSMAKRYGASMSDTLNVESQLAATGLKSSELYKATASAMHAAMLGELDYNDTIKTTIALHSILHHSSTQVNQDWNYMNKIENQTSLTMQDLAQAIPIALGPVKQLGGSLQDLGTMLAAMKEKGIDAQQGANALKNSLTRLYRPSKQVSEEFEQLTGKSLDGLINKSTSLIDAFKLLSQATDNLSGKDKTRVFAGLFGAHQVTRLQALVSGMGDLAKGTGQVTEAYNIGNESAVEWAKTTKNETDQAANSVSGRFKRAAETIKISMATMGKPFLEFTTIVLKGINKVIEGFNSLPKHIKNSIAVGMLLLAIVGPITMLVGLLKNLQGGMMMAGAKVLGMNRVIKFFGGTLELATKEEVAQNKMLDLMIASFKGVEGATVNATTAVQEFIQALAHSQHVTRDLQLDVLATNMRGMTDPKTGKTYDEIAIQKKITEVKAASERENLPEGYGISKTGVYYNAGTGYRVKPEEVQAAREKEALARKTADSAEKEEEATQKTAKGINAARVSGALFAASLATSLTTSGKISDNFSKWAMVLAVTLPLMTGIGKSMKVMAAGKFMEAIRGSKLVTGAKNFGAAYAGRAVATGAAGAAGAAGEAAGAGGIMAGLGAIGISGGMLATAGIGAGIAAGVVGLMAWHKHMEQVKKDAIDDQKAINNMGDTWLNILGKAKYQYKTISDMTPKIAGTKTNIDQMADQFKRSKNGKQLISDFNESGGSDSVKGQTILMNQFHDVWEGTGHSIKQTQAAMTAFLTAAGKDTISATVEAQQLVDKWKDFKNLGWQTVKQEISSALLETDDNKIKGAADKTAKTWIDAFARANRKQRGELTKGLVDSYNSSLSGLSKELPAYMKKNNLTLGQVYQRVSIARSSMGPGIASLDPTLQKVNFDNLKRVNDYWGEIVHKLKQTSLFKNINSVLGISDNATVDLYTARGKSAKDTAAGRAIASSKAASAALLEAAAQGHLADALKDINVLQSKNSDVADRAAAAQNLFGDSSAHATIKLLRQIPGMNNLWQGYYSSAKGADAATNSTNKLTAAMKNANAARTALSSALSGGFFTNTAQSAISDIQTQIGSDVSDNFSAAQAAAEQANSNRWQARSNAMSNRQQKQTDALQKAQAKREAAISKSYDDRIKKIQKEMNAEQRAEDQRQRIFEAEQTRIDRLKTMQDSRIDFNVAVQQGQFDEAAKMLNDMQAQTQQWAVQDAQAADANASKKNADLKQKRIDDLNDAKDKALKKYQAEEALQQKHLQKMQQNQQQALQREQQASENATTAIWADRKKKLDMALADLNSYIPTSEADLQQHINNVEAKYGVFADNQKLSSEALHQFIATNFDTKMKQAADNLRSQIKWASIGKDVVQQMVFGPLGFTSLSQFKHFMLTGEMPSAHHKNPTAGGNNEVGVGTGSQNKPLNQPGHEHHHTGGWVGSNYGTAHHRRGLSARAPLQSNERTVTAEDGEFFVRKDKAKKHANVLEAINNGLFDKTVDHNAKGGYGGPLAMMGAAYMAAAMKGVRSGFKRIVKKKKQEIAAQRALSALMGMFSAPGAGEYGGVSLDANQLKNAALIANVGSKMHMSARDVEIALMTAMQESSLINLTGGDRDSAGLFQQRPSQGWGTYSQVTNPEHASATFFNHLKGVRDRGSMPMTQAAQAVQRSAYPDAYAKWQGMAIALFNNLKRTGGNGAIGGGFVGGAGGKHRPIRGYPVTNGIHDVSTGYPAVDIAAPIGTPVYAISNGQITRSYDIRGNEPRRTTYGHHSEDGYRSYGRVIYLRTDSGDTALYAHLNDRFVRAGQRVKGGSVIGKSGNTGNVQSSSGNGAHLHFGSSPISPTAWLKTGGFTLTDGMAMLHKNEAVLTAPLTEKLHQGIDNFAEGGNRSYTLNFYGVTDKEEIASYVINTIKREDARKPRSRKG